MSEQERREAAGILSTYKDDDKDKHKDKKMTNTLREHLQRATLETYDL